MLRPIPISYRFPAAQGTQNEQYWYDEGLFDCFSGVDVGPRCCIIQTCCCAGYAHSQAIGWVDADLGGQARKAWYRMLAAEAIRSVSTSNVNGQTVVNPFGEVLATANEVVSDLSYIDIRRELTNRLFGVWRKNSLGKTELYWSPQAPNFLRDCCLQVCCAGLARIQETSTAMRWRVRKTGRPVRYANPCFCNCGFEEYIDGQWRAAMTSIPLELQEQGSDLLNRTAPPGVFLPPVPLIAIRA